MPHYNIQNPVTKQWRCFSTIIDDWLCDWKSEDEYKDWLINRVVQDMLYEFERKGIETSKWYSYEDAIYTAARSAWKNHNCHNCTQRDCDNCKIYDDLETYISNGDDFLGIMDELLNSEGVD